MKSETSCFFKGLGIGMAAGATAAIVSKVMLTDAHKTTKGSAKLIKAVGDFADGIQTIFR